MTNVKNAFQKIFKASSYEERVQRAKERFQFKPFIVQYEGVKKLANLRPILHLISILLALMLVYTVLEEIFHNKAFSLFIAIFFLGLWESLKSRFITIAFEQFYTSFTISFFACLFGLLTLLGSVYLSLEGSALYHQEYSTTLQDYEVFHQSKVDSVQDFYTTKIQGQEDSLQAYKNSIEWLGRIDMSNKATQEMIASFAIIRTHLETEKKQALTKLENEYKANQSSLTESVTYNKAAFILIASINELLILFLMWFVVYYDYMAKKQANTISKMNKQTLVSIEDVQKLFELSDFSTNLSPNVRRTGTNANANLIGFKTASNSYSKTNYLDKYKDVVYSIEQGLNEVQILETHDVGRTTLYNIKRAMRQKESV